MLCFPEQKSRQAKSKDISHWRFQKNEGDLDLPFFELYLLIRNKLRCFNTEFFLKKEKEKEAERKTEKKN